MVQGVWLRAGLGVGRDWGTGRVAWVYGVGQKGRDWGWVGVRWVGGGRGMRAGIGVCTGVLGEWVSLGYGRFGGKTGNGVM